MQKGFSLISVLITIVIFIYVISELFSYFARYNGVEMIDGERLKVGQGSEEVVLQEDALIEEKVGFLERLKNMLKKEVRVDWQIEQAECPSRGLACGEL